VTHEARVVVDLVDRNDDLMVMHVLKRGREGFDLERSGGSIACYVDAPHDPALVAEDFVRFLRTREVENLVVLPPRIETWNAEMRMYLAADDRVEELSPPLTHITWHVAVTPTAFFDWDAALDQLDRRNRPPIRETRKLLDVPAEDEADAYAIAEGLRHISGLGPMRIEKLGWFRRWLARERVFGSYADGGG
jgi:hypothetical protein